MDLRQSHAISLNELIADLGSDREKGLTADDVLKNFERFGSNSIPAEKGRHPLRIFLKQLNSLMVCLLLIAAGLSFWFQEYLDGTAILLVILINAVIGFWMELQAQRSMNALRKMASAPSKVYRNGNLIEVSSEELVPGDLLFIEAGDMIAADARIVHSAELSVNEASLTGEAMSVEKKETELPEKTPLAERSNMVHKGTYVTNGNARALVTETGMQTELGKIAHLLKSATKSATPLEVKLQVFSRKLIYITIVLVVLIFGAGLLKHDNYAEMLQTAIALAVAAIPEGLPVVATLALAQGMVKMAKHKVIVKKLAAVETLGGTTIICTDKTGTLTQNKIEVNEVFPLENNGLLTRIGVLCNTASVEIKNQTLVEIGDPLETSLLKYALKQGVSKVDEERKFPKISEVPFSSETKMMATLHRNGNGFIVFAKGAAEEILDKCLHIANGEDKKILSPETGNEWKTKAENLAASGLRVVAGAFKETVDENASLPGELTFAGLYALTDPPAEDVYQALRETEDAGIKVVMITGDHPATANYIANQLRISSADHVPIQGKDMQPFEKLTEADKQAWLHTSVFARVTPVQKLDLVSVLQEKGNIVGMTGDGVNDAPALKKADIGIAMGQRGTQVAREVSDMVLEDDTFSSIVHAIKQGRIIFNNIQKFVIYLLSCNMSELFVVSVAALSDLHFQLLPLQILFINLVTDVLPALALGVGEGNPFVMKQKPRNPVEPLLKTKQWYAVWIYAAVISACTLGAVFISHYAVHTGAGFDPRLCNNILFFTLIFCQLFHVFNMASSDMSFFRSEVFRNKYVWYALLSCLLILLSVFIVEPMTRALDIQPLGGTDWIVVFAFATFSLIIIQLLKRIKLIRDED